MGIESNREMDSNVEKPEEKPPNEVKEEDEAKEEDEEEEELSWSSSESEIGDVLDYLDSKDELDGIDAGFKPQARRPNAHGGFHTFPNTSSFQPLSNKNQKLISRVRASPLEEWEGRMYVGMSNSVATAIRGSVRDMAIGKTKTTEKADRATVEQFMREVVMGIWFWRNQEFHGSDLYRPLKMIFVSEAVPRARELKLAWL